MPRSGKNWPKLFRALGVKLGAMVGQVEPLLTEKASGRTGRKRCVEKQRGSVGRRGIVVTTPQTVSLADTRRAVRMYEKLNIPTLGIVENMSHFVCPGCARESDIFGKGGGERLAEDMKVPFLGRIPLYEPVRSGGDRGVPIVVEEPESVAAQALRSVAERAAAQVSISSYRKTIPLTPVR